MRLYQFNILFSKYTDVVKKRLFLLSSTLKSALVKVSGGLVFASVPFMYSRKSVGKTQCLRKKGYMYHRNGSMASLQRALALGQNLVLQFGL